MKCQTRIAEECQNSHVSDNMKNLTTNEVCKQVLKQDCSEGIKTAT